jgi:hypothetical protein
LNKLLIIGCFFLLTSSSFAQPGIRGLPSGALVVETRKLPVPNRTLVLWMINPKKTPNRSAPDDIYACPDQTRGSYYSGPTRVSLINSVTHRVINTINVSGDSIQGGDGLDVPYAIRKGYYYQVEATVRKGVEAKPTIIWLRDYNGDGRALEFALFDAPACMGLQTALIGYSEKQDRVLQYPIKLEITEGSRQSSKVELWAEYLFSKKPVRRGYWKYEIDYTGRGGSLDKWEVRYNVAKEQFEAKLTVVPGD